MRDLHSFNLASGALLMIFSGMKNAKIFHGEGVSLVKSSKILLCLSLEAEPGPCPKAEPLFLDCSSLISASPPFPD